MNEGEFVEPALADPGADTQIDPGEVLADG